MHPKKEASYCIDCGSEIDSYGRCFPSKQPDGYYINFLESAAIIQNKEGGIILHSKDGKLYLPSALVKNKEDPSAAAIRAVKEAVGIEAANAQIVSVVGDPKRNPKGCYTCCVYKLECKEGVYTSAEYIKSHVSELASEFSGIILKALNIC